MSEDTRFEAVDVLWDDDMDGLMLTLAARVKADEEGTAQDELKMWDPPEETFASEEEMGPEITATMKAFAARWWETFEPKIYDLLCNKENKEHDKFMEALQEGGKMLAVTLAPALLAPTGWAAIAMVVATIAAKKIAESGLEVMCAMWKESLDKEAEAEGEGE